MKFWARRKKKEQGKPIVENQHQLIVKTKTSDDGMNMVLRSSQRDNTEVSSDNVEESLFRGALSSTPPGSRSSMRKDRPTIKSKGNSYRSRSRSRETRSRETRLKSKASCSGTSNSVCSHSPKKDALASSPTARKAACAGRIAIRKRGKETGSGRREKLLESDKKRREELSAILYRESQNYALRMARRKEILNSGKASFNKGRSRTAMSDSSPLKHVDHNACVESESNADIVRLLRKGEHGKASARGVVDKDDNEEVKTQITDSEKFDRLLALGVPRVVVDAEIETLGRKQSPSALAKLSKEKNHVKDESRHADSPRSPSSLSVFTGSELQAALLGARESLRETKKTSFFTSAQRRKSGFNLHQDDEEVLQKREASLLLLDKLSRQRTGCEDRSVDGDTQHGQSLPLDHALAAWALSSPFPQGQEQSNDAEKLLGEGRFSSVVSIVMRTKGESVNVALKRFRFRPVGVGSPRDVTSSPSSSRNESKYSNESATAVLPPVAVLEMFEKELTAAVALRRIQSPYLIRPLASALNVPPYHGPCIAFEFAKGGTLYTLLRTDEEARSVGEGNSVTGILSASERVGLAEDVARGLAAMHEAGWAHLDIKDHNIVVEPSRETHSRVNKEEIHGFPPRKFLAKIADFGSARPVFPVRNESTVEASQNAPATDNEHTRLRNTLYDCKFSRFIVAATAGWAAPEVLNYIEEEDGGLINNKAATESDRTIHSNISCSADCFSFGVLLWVCLLRDISEKHSLTAQHRANPLASLDAERAAYALRAGVQPYWPTEDDDSTPTQRKKKSKVRVSSAVSKVGELLKACWNLEPAERPKMAEVAERMGSDIRPVWL